MTDIDRGGDPIFVVFEGLDGAGKSTCAQLVASRLDAVLLTTPSREVRAYRDDLVSSFAGCQEACQLFYLSTVFAVSEQVRALLARGRSVVLDRYFLSTQAYAAFRGSRLRLDRVASLLLPACLTVFLDLPLEVRRSRLSLRGKSSADRETLSVEADACLRHEHVRRSRLGVAGRFLQIDSALLGPEEIAVRVLEWVAEQR